MNQATARQMIAADILKLRRHRPTMATAALLSAGMAIVYFAFIEARHHGNLAGPQALSDGASLMGDYFGAFAAWDAVATTVQTTLAVGIASLTGSRPVTLIAVIGWNTIATGISYLASFLGPVRDLVLLIALGALFPGQQAGSRAHPGSSIALNNFFRLGHPVSSAPDILRPA